MEICGIALVVVSTAVGRVDGRVEPTGSHGLREIAAWNGQETSFASSLPTVGSGHRYVMVVHGDTAMVQYGIERLAVGPQRWRRRLMLSLGKVRINRKDRGQILDCAG